MSEPPLLCTVRDCDERLRRGDGRLTCARGHSFDVARSGYLNLLQPQDRRSPQAGDSKSAVAARAALLKAGVGSSLLDAVAEIVAALPLAGSPPIVVELGSGSGDLLAKIAGRRPVAGVGIDLSTAAADLSARRFPSLTWVVANADRRLPLADQSAALVVSVHARRNPDESHRILDARGLLLVAVPGADDLIELRALVQGTGVERDRVDAVISEHAGRFTMASRTTVREQLPLDRATLLLLLETTYRGMRRSESARAQALDSLHVTLASDVLLFRPR